MALDIGGILQTTSKIFGGNQNQYFNTISNVAGLASQFVPAKVTPAMAKVPQAALSMVPRAAGALVSRGFFSRFPNLATAIQQLRARGMNVKRAQLYRMLRRFGPELLISGGLLTAAAVNELLVAGPGSRRMNPANVKALRRSASRIRSFHKLCGTVDLLKSRGRSRGKRCGTCRKSPCGC